MTFFIHSLLRELQPILDRQHASGANKSGVRKYGPVQQYDQKWKTGIRCAAEVTANVSAGVHGSATVSKSGETFVKKYVTGEKYL